MSIIPLPYELIAGSGEPFVLGPGTRVVAPDEVAASVAWFASALEAQTGIGGAGTSPAALPVLEVPAVTVELGVDEAVFAGLPETGGRRADDGDANGERYALTIAAEGVTIQAATPEGAFRGLTTLLQLAATADVVDGAVSLPPVTVRDTPRFAWRGLSFDVVRSAFAAAEVKQVIDLLALYKLNVLHLHLTDSEGWRIEIDSWPKLTEIGGQTAKGTRPGGFYTKDDFRDLVAHAAERFVTVVPEIEMPGHTAAIFASYPELAGIGDGAVQEQSHHFQAMDPANPQIFGFIDDVLGEMATLTPGGRIHIGGDEALGMNDEQYHGFMTQALAIARSTGKGLVAWQEVARAGFEPGDICQLWISPGQGEDVPEIDPADLPEDFELPPNPEALFEAFKEFLKLAQLDLDKALEQGADILVSQQNRSYLDTKYREQSSDPAMAARQKALGMPFYPKTTVEEFFDWDPGSIRESLEESRIVGVEAAIWCETLPTLDDVLFMVLPRLPGIAEKGWSAAGTDWAGYRPRLQRHDRVWERRGWSYFRSPLVWEDLS